MAYTTLSRFRCQTESWNLVYGRWWLGNSMVSDIPCAVRFRTLPLVAATGYAARSALTGGRRSGRAGPLAFAVAYAGRKAENTAGPLI